MWTLPQDEWPEPTTHQTKTSTGKWCSERTKMFPPLAFVHHLHQHFTSISTITIKFNIQNSRKHFLNTFKRKEQEQEL